MKYVALILLAMACGKKADAPSAEGLAEAAPSKSKKDKDKPATPSSGGPGLHIEAVVPEFSGTYDKAFALAANDSEPLQLAFVRDCPALACTDNAFEAESVTKKCPKAFVAYASLKGEDPKPGHHRSDFNLASASGTSQLEHVHLEIDSIDADHVKGSAELSKTDSKISGSFDATVCGRM
ncbi:MAG: hypothetical protein QM831_03440 [Kofleriaceae bacterium]